ncbi:MAG TPA: DUF5017 domain-containing protein [Membranihabitans sp.]|nr:DUF5017 domain-containing protein [Membranihabitans sp.]
MNYYRLILAGVFLWMNISCEKEIAVDSAPDLQVSADQTTYSVGEEALFHVSGFAEIISFYSGEVGNDYEFRDGRVVDVANNGAILSFTNAVQNGSQENQLSLFISTDFDGDTSSLASIKSATWVEVTDSFELSTSSTFIPAGELDISSFTESGPVYIAFRYITRPQMEHGDARQWMIENFEIATRDTIFDDRLTILNQSEMGFYVVDEDRTHNPSRSSVTPTRLSILGNTYADPADPIFDPENPIFDPENPIYDPDSDVYDPTAMRPEYVPYDPQDPYNDPRRETWVVSKPITIDQVNMGPDWAQGIRGIRDQKLVEFSYSYSTPGEYNAVFIGRNVTIDDGKEVILEVPITIVP